MHILVPTELYNVDVHMKDAYMNDHTAIGVKRWLCHGQLLEFIIQVCILQFYVHTCALQVIRHYQCRCRIEGEYCLSRVTTRF